MVKNERFRAHSMSMEVSLALIKSLKLANIVPYKHVPKLKSRASVLKYTLQQIYTSPTQISQSIDGSHRTVIIHVVYNYI